MAAESVAIHSLNGNPIAASGTPAGDRARRRATGSESRGDPSRPNENEKSAVLRIGGGIP